LIAASTPKIAIAVASDTPNRPTSRWRATLPDSTSQA
jgi:hypothetical protein